MSDEQQVALITGGSSGLGRAIAVELAGKHFCVAIVARSQQRLTETAEAIKQSGGQVLAVQADVTDRTAVERMVKGLNTSSGPSIYW